MSLRVAVVRFPGTNCESDVLAALDLLGGASEVVSHQRRDLKGFDAVVLPGGFAHGDYLRPGAIARFSPVMDSVAVMAREGAPVIGICNGFQILTESGLLPGALQRNKAMRFICAPTWLEVASTKSVLTRSLSKGQRVNLPINHFSGSYVCDEATLRRLEEEERVVLRYESNPNGSIADIAGICNEQGNIVGLMPHPERACDSLSGETDGALLLGQLTGDQRATSCS
jgi:phosphoribosylformylglycinamidine synthase I